MDLKMEYLLENKQLITNILYGHFAREVKATSELKNGDVLDSYSEEINDLQIRRKQTQIKVEGVKISLKDSNILAEESIIHVIEEVLLPQSVFEVIEQQWDVHGAQFFWEAIGQQDQIRKILSNGWSTLTVLVPTNKAFRNLADDLWLNFRELRESLEDCPGLLTKILAYHISTTPFYNGEIELTTLVEDSLLYVTIDDDDDEEEEEEILIENKYGEEAVVIDQKTVGKAVILFVDEVLLPFELEDYWHLESGDCKQEDLENSLNLFLKCQYWFDQC
eukprot:TRINITY_DN1560_c1_g1_i1.p2 TRINITY_DN1560_c1_g1~~TRINITY_DN1560_c1_g1_i1.p2  ORF type:complete len:277 (-),score=45.87 TRINITY_DN1560_c1_g1_i1:154-984(-)